MARSRPLRSPLYTRAPVYFCNNGFCEEETVLKQRSGRRECLIKCYVPRISVQIMIESSDLIENVES